jgi:hypothetical protein
MTTMRTQLWTAPLLAASLLLGGVAACSDPISPAVRAAAGTYAATRLITTETGAAPTDQLAAGVSIVFTLNANGTTSGRFIVPGELDASLAGTWTLNGTTVQLNHSADTFLRNMPLQVQGNTLVGDRTVSGTRVQLTLTKQ